MHFVIYLPDNFYSAIASTYVEILQAINQLEGNPVLTFEFVSAAKQAVSRSGIIYATKTKPSKKIDVLVLLSGMGVEAVSAPELMDAEWRAARSLIKMATTQQAILAATCGASHMLAAYGALEGKRATISWWLKEEMKQRYPGVKWQPARIMVRDGNIYTSGGGFSGLELITALLADLGFTKEERKVRKLMVLPSLREFQSPYEFALEHSNSQLDKQLHKLFKNDTSITIARLAEALRMSPRTMARKFEEELQLSPGKWLQQKRLDMAKSLLEASKHSIAEICYEIGFEDPASFSRLFSKETGMSPGEFRKQLHLPPGRRR